MREKYESLSLVTLKSLAKARGLKGISTLRKPALIERMLEEDEKDAQAKREQEAAALKEQEQKAREEREAAARKEEQKVRKEREAAAQKAGEEREAAAPKEPQEKRVQRTQTAEQNQPAVKEQPANYETAQNQNAESQENSTQRSYRQENRSSGENGEKRYYTNNRYQNNQNRYNSRYQGSQNRYNNQNRYQNSQNRYQNSQNRYNNNRYEDRSQDSDYQDRNQQNTQERSQNYQERNQQTGQERSQNYQERSQQNSQDRSQNYQERSQQTGQDRNQSYQDRNQGYQERSQGYQSQNYQDRSQAVQGRTQEKYEEASQNRYEETKERYQDRNQDRYDEEQRLPSETADLDSGEKANGILEVLPDGYGFIRCENYLPGENDIYVSPSQIRRFNLKTGDILTGSIRIKTQGEKFSALLFVDSINGFSPEEGQKRYNFEDMTPIFPNKRLVMERPGGTMAMRIVDLISPIGKGQRGMIVSPPKAGKTTLLKDVAKSLLRNSPSMHLIILLIDERPEEVTDIKEAIQGPNVEVIYSTFDELPEHHKRVSEMVVERARRLVEHKQDVTILLDSITRLARAYNLCVPPSGRTLSGGLDPAALHMPKRFFGAARNMREGGSLTILATALVDTGSKMDDVIYEEFKGTGNMELVLDRKLQEKRVFPAIDIQKSGTRREDLLLSKDEMEAVYNMRKALNGMKSDEAVEQILNMFSRTRSNAEFVQIAQKQKFL